MKKKILFICGSMNQTTQMHQIAMHLSDCDHSFSPFYCHGFEEILRKLGLIEFTIAGNQTVDRCRTYLRNHGLRVDYRGKNQPYDLVVTCTDVYLQRNIRDNRIVLVQEGMIDPESIMFRLVKRLRFLPGWMADTAMTGASDAYLAFCVASKGYRDFFTQRGAPPEKIVVTGIPNFDNCRRYFNNDFPYKNYVLACTSALREVYRREDRAAFIRKAVAIAAGRTLIFKLHPIENVARATQEINRYAPGAMVFTTGSAEEMIANCDVLITRFSSTAFVGVALGKETYSDFDMERLRHLMPLQNGSAALNIATVCRRLIEADCHPLDAASPQRSPGGVKAVTVS
ncbi:MAG: hypothetical protein R6W95_05860 [Desulfosarcina sp.]